MEKNRVVFVTGSEYKFKVVTKVLEGSGVEVIQNKLETPEIQSDRVDEVVYYSCWWAYRQLKVPVLLNDSGYFIEALGGFPGPLVKFVSKWLGPEDWLRVMEGKKNRRVVVRSAWAFCKGEEGPKVEVAETLGSVAQVAGQKGETSLHSVFVPRGFEKPQSEIAFEEMAGFWERNLQVRERVERLVG